MRKSIIFLCLLIICAFSLQLKKKNRNKIKHRNSIRDDDDNCQTANQFMIISRATGYHLSLALRFVGQNNQNYYWVIELFY